jgi:hypothetical protein
MMDACDHAEHAAKPETAAAIHPRVFRRRVPVASKYHFRFKPRNGSSNESAA